MESMKKHLISVFAVLLFFASAAVAEQDYEKNDGDYKINNDAPPNYIRYGNCEFDPAKMLEGIHLADEQKAQIEGIIKINDDSLKKADERTKAEKLKVYESLKGDAADENIREANKDLQGAHAELSGICLDYLLGIRTLLTPEQRKQMKMPSDEPVVMPKIGSPGADGKSPRAGGRGGMGRGRGPRGGW